MRITKLLLIGLAAASLTISACDKKGDASAKGGDKAAAKKDDKAAAKKDDKAAAKKDDEAAAKKDDKAMAGHAGHDMGAMKGHDMAKGGDDKGAGNAAPGTVTTGEHGKALLAAYEKLRLALSADNWDGAKAAATALGEWAQKNATMVDPALKPHLEAIVTGAAKVLTAADIEAARSEPFGNISKHTIAVVVLAKDLGEGVTVYRCPMAKAYKKWLQLNDDMANPYMGKRMLKCGGKVKTEV